VLGGIATDVAVESTVRAASDLGYRTIVVSDACIADTDEAHAHSLEVIQKWFGEALTADEVLSSLDKAAQRSAAKHAAMAKPQVLFTGRAGRDPQPRSEVREFARTQGSKARTRGCGTAIVS
jgi:isochorismatase family protein